ncbi:hypothetical protein QUC31_004730 [Theobroma cacao]
MRNNEKLQMRWKHERLAKEKFLAQATSIRKERKGFEVAAKVEEDKIKQKVEKDMHKYEEEIKELKDKLSELKMKLDSSKIAALRRGSDGGNGQCFSINEGNQVPSFSERVVDIKEYSGNRGLKQERECIMCLSKEKTVVFLPCAHQVLKLCEWKGRYVRVVKETDLKSVGHRPRRSSSSFLVLWIGFTRHRIAYNPSTSL